MYVIITSVRLQKVKLRGEDPIAKLRLVGECIKTTLSTKPYDFLLTSKNKACILVSSR